MLLLEVKVTLSSMAKHNSIPAPQIPSLDPDGNGFISWRRDIYLWVSVTKVPANQRATHIYLSFKEGKAKKAAEQIAQGDLQSVEGVELLIKTLEDHFLPSKPMRLFNAYHNLRYVTRKSGVSINDYLAEFEHAKFLLEKEGIRKDDTILALDLLSQCNLPIDKTQLVMSSISAITYENVKEKLNTIYFMEQAKHNKFANSASCSDTNTNNFLEEALVSEEPQGEGSSLYTTGRGRKIYRSKRGLSHRNFSRSRSNFRRGRYQGSRRTNPIGRNGQPTTCILCDSIYHYVQFCPNKNDNKRDIKFEEDIDKIHFNMFVGCTSDNSNNRLSDLVNESRGYAILDSGCTNTVCGEQWIQNFIDNLSLEEREKMIISPSDQKFTFGDGRSVTSKRKVTIPCWMGGERGRLTTDVVDSNIPLLLSRRSMKRSEMVLDFKNDKVQVNGRDIRLKITHTGHYALPLSL